MFIQTEDTPNPLTIKFLPGKEVMKTGTADFKNKELSANSPLASRLFDVEGIDGVFLGSDFISVTKKKDEEWFSLKPSVFIVKTDSEVIMIKKEAKYSVKVLKDIFNLFLNVFSTKK